MRKLLMASAALMGLALSAPAWAQGTDTNTNAGGTGTGGASTTQGVTSPMSGEATPQSGQNSQATGTMGSSDQTGSTMGGASGTAHHMQATSSGMVPALPVDGSPQHYLRVAREALRAHRGREAEDALERAETRLLDRSTPASAANQPDTAPAITQINQAREALGRRDWQQARQSIESAMNTPGLAANDSMGGTGGNGSGMTGTSGMNGNAGVSNNPASSGSSSTDMNGGTGMGGSSSPTMQNGATGTGGATQ